MQFQYLHFRWKRCTFIADLRATHAVLAGYMVPASTVLVTPGSSYKKKRQFQHMECFFFMNKSNNWSVAGDVVGSCQLFAGFFAFSFFFLLWSLRVAQIRRDIQNLTDSPVRTQSWPLWVNLIICVCRPVRVLSLRGTVSPQPPPCFCAIPESWPSSSPTGRETSGNTAQTNFQPSGGCRLWTSREWNESKTWADGGGEPESSSHLDFLRK